MLYADNTFVDAVVQTASTVAPHPVPAVPIKLYIFPSRLTLPDISRIWPLVIEPVREPWNWNDTDSVPPPVEAEPMPLIVTWGIAIVTLMLSLTAEIGMFA
jgi:hypothetical protein